MRILLPAALCGVLLAQSPQPPGQPASPPALVYEGKPLPLAAVCADAEISDFGLDCPADSPCPVYLDLAGLEIAGAKIFIAGNFHTSSATLWSLILSSDDEGKTWQEPMARIRGAALDQIQFIDFQHGWISGELSGALPKDPFLLRTLDGGKSWRRLPIYEESAYGAVDQFWFDSPTHGVLLLYRRGSSSGRNQKLESMTGGDSWMMRQSSRTAIPSPKPRAAGNPDWRLRADAPSRSHRIERRQAGKWLTVSAFLFRAGECKPAPPKPAEPEKPADPPQP